MAGDWRDELDALARRALALAIARYATDHPDVQERAASWLAAAGHEGYLAMTVDGMRTEASSALRELDRLEENVGQADEGGEERRIVRANARLALQSARSGSFGTAAGPLRDFLRDIGETPDALDVH